MLFFEILWWMQVIITDQLMIMMIMIMIMILIIKVLYA